MQKQETNAIKNNTEEEQSNKPENNKMSLKIKANMRSLSYHAELDMLIEMFLNPTIMH